MRHIPKKVGLVAVALALAIMLSAGVAWIENNKKPKMRDNEPLTAAQLTDVAYKRGRDFFRQAVEIEDKALAATSDGKRRRYREKAMRRYRASTDAYELCLKRALEADITPGYLPNLYQELGDALFKVGEYERAIESYTKTLHLAPAYTRATYGRAEAQLALDNVAGMQAGFAKILVETETSAEAWGYVDALLASSEQWLVAQESDHATTDRGTVHQFRSWRTQQVAELEDTVRWTLLDAQ